MKCDASSILQQQVGIKKSRNVKSREWLPSIKTKSNLAPRFQKPRQCKVVRLVEKRVAFRVARPADRVETFSIAHGMLERIDRSQPPVLPYHTMQNNNCACTIRHPNLESTARGTSSLNSQIRCRITLSAMKEVKSHDSDCSQTVHCRLSMSRSRLFLFE